VNKFTDAELVVPNTLLTALGEWTSSHSKDRAHSQVFCWV